MGEAGSFGGVASAVHPVSRAQAEAPRAGRAAKRARGAETPPRRERIQAALAKPAKPVVRPARQEASAGAGCDCRVSGGTPSGGVLLLGLLGLVGARRTRGGSADSLDYSLTLAAASAAQ